MLMSPDLTVKFAGRFAGWRARWQDARVTKGRRRTPDRQATRRGATGVESGSPRLVLVPGPDHTGDLEVVLDPELSLSDMVGDLATEMVRAVAAARTPLDAELAFGPVLGMLDRLAPEESTPQERAAMRHDLLSGLISWAEAAASPGALAFLRVAAVLGDPQPRHQAGAAADRLAASGVPDRPWVSALGRPALVRAWWYGDVFGNQESVALLYDYHHREHTLSVLIDHELGGGVKDCWIAEGRKTRGLRDRTAAEMADNPMATFEDIDAERAVETLGAALRCPPCPVEPDQVEDVTACLEILRARVATLAGSPD
jgi:hypothetical protein